MYQDLVCDVYFAFSYPGRHFWKGGGILSGLDLEAQDYLLLDSFFSEYCLFF